MKRIVAATTLVIAMMFTAAFAQPFIWIDDDGIDYDKTSLSRAYIGFEMHEGDLIVRVDDQRFDGALPAIDFDVPNLVDRQDFFGNDINADMSNIPDMVWLGVNDDGPQAAYLVGFQATHLNTSLERAIEAYEAAFRSMGFDAQVSDTAARSVKIATFTNGDATLEARLHATGGDVAVTLRTN
jgi:hypothetical protein